MPSLAASALAVVAGLAYFAAFPSLDLWPLAFVALVPVLWIIEEDRLSAAGAIVAGLLFAFVANLAGYRFLVVPLTQFFGLSLPSAVGVMVAFCLYQSGQLAAFVLVLWFWRARLALSLYGAVPLWLVIEWAYPHVFPTFFGNALHRVPVAAQIADLGGLPLVSALLVLTNVAVFEVGRGLWRRERLPRGALVTLPALWVGTLVYGAYRMVEVEGLILESRPVKVALVQANVPAREKRDDPKASLRRHRAQSHELEQDRRPDLIIWPETSVGIVRQPDIIHGKLGTPLLFGGTRLERAAGKKRAHNSAFLTSAGGEPLGHYDKSVLLVFAEYLPFVEQLPELEELLPNAGGYTAGQGSATIDFGEHRLGVLICYEDVLPSLVGKIVRKAQPELLVNLTNDAWFGDTAEPWIHLALSKFRAIEHRRFLVRATNTGVSAVIDPTGRIMARTGVFERTTLVSEAAWMAPPTLYTRAGPWPVWASALMVTAWVGIKRWRALLRRPAG